MLDLQTANLQTHYLNPKPLMPEHTSTPLPSSSLLQTQGPKAASDPGQLRQLISAINQLVTPGEGNADIWPGRRHPLPVNALTWTTFMMSPPVGWGGRGGGWGGRVRGVWEQASGGREVGVRSWGVGCFRMG